MKKVRMMGIGSGEASQNIIKWLNWLNTTQFFYHWAKMTPQLRFMRITILQPDYTYIYLYVNGRTCIVFQVCAYTMYVRYLSIMSSRWACSGATSLVWSFPFGCPVRNCCGDRNSCRVTNTIHAIVHTVYIYIHTQYLFTYRGSYRYMLYHVINTCQLSQVRDRREYETDLNKDQDLVLGRFAYNLSYTIPPMNTHQKSTWGGFSAQNVQTRNLMHSYACLRQFCPKVAEIRIKPNWQMLATSINPIGLVWEYPRPTSKPRTRPPKACLVVLTGSKRLLFLILRT